MPFAAAWSTAPLAGNIYAQPLVYDGLVIVATESDDVYAFNETTGAPAWHVALGTPVPSTQLPCGDIKPTVGITSTPVIDPATGTLYLVGDFWNGTSAAHQMYALNATTGATVWGPKAVDPPGSFPLNQLQRSSLNLDGGQVLFGFGGNDGDCGAYWGFLASVSEDGSTATYWKAPTVRGGAIWATGGPTVDSAGNVYVVTGNSGAGLGKPFDWSESVIQFSSPTSFPAKPSNYFTPSSWQWLNAEDLDLGSATPALLPGNEAYVDGKDGNGYLISTTNLGGIGGQLFKSAISCKSFGADAYDNGVIYVACLKGGMRALALHGAKFSKLWTGPTASNGPPIVAGGLVWVTSFTNSRLYGLNSQTGKVIVSQATPAMEHFTSPSASDGLLFLATDNTVEAYRIAQAVAR